MRKFGIVIAITGVFLTARLMAHSASGAIYTTLGDGSEVNFNIYDAKEDVHLNGGPGPGAPPGAAALEDGLYVFQLTDPSGHTLLSEDPPRCRIVEVVNGVFDNTDESGACKHPLGAVNGNGGFPVLLMPYADTPNNGGEYKVWITPLSDFEGECGDIETAVLECDGFLGGHIKTDNFKVRGSIQEIDTRFFPDLNRNGIQDLPWEQFMDGLGITWFDTVGGSNRKWSYYNPSIMVFHEAHVEAVEKGRHKILIQNQTGCTVGTVYKAGKKLPKKGPQSVSVNVPQDFKGSDTVFIDVACLP